MYFNLNMVYNISKEESCWRHDSSQQPL